MGEEPAFWTGQRLELGAVSLFLTMVPGQSGDSGEVMLGAASDGETSVGLSREHLGRFLRQHENATLVCYDAAGVHWLIRELLIQAGDQATIPVLWQFSRECRLVDVGLLDQRFRLVAEGVYPSPRPLQDLASTYGASAAARSTIGPRASSEQYRCHAEAVLGIYRELDRRIAELTSNLHIPLELVRRFGPLGHGLDVQGAIAVGAPGTTITVAPAGAIRLESALKKAYRRSSELLSSDRLVRRIFAWESDQVARDKNGYVRWNEGQLRDWLTRRADEMQDLNQHPLDRPLDDKGRVSLHPEHWGKLAHCHPLLRAWSTLVRAAALERAFRAADDRLRLSVRYRHVPHLHAHSPELDEARGLADRVFQPPPDRQFVVCALPDLHLRCLAMVSERHRHVGKLAQTFRDGDDPVAQLAEELEDLIAGRRDSAVPGTAGSRWVRRMTAERWTDLARVLLSAVSQGLAAVHTRELIREALPDCEVSELEMESLQTTLFRNACPELEDFLADDTVQRLADQTGVEFALLCKKLLKEFPVCEPTPQALGATVRRALRDGPGEGIVRILDDVARDRGDRKAVGLQDLLALLRECPVTLFGQVGQPTIGGQARGREFDDLADGILKRVAFELAAGGYPVVAVARDEIVVEVCGDNEHAEEPVATLVEAALKRLWASAPDEQLPHRTVPIACDCYPDDRW